MVHPYNAHRLIPTFGLEGFARKVCYDDLTRPPCITEPRWAAILAWWANRQAEGVKVEDFCLFGSYTKYHYDD